MKTIQSIFFISLFFIGPRAFCQAKETPAQKISRLEDLERSSILKSDTQTLFQLWSAEYIVSNPNNMILNAAQIKSFIRSGGIDHTPFTRNIERMTFTKGIAIVMGTEIVSPKSKTDNDGKNVTRRFTDVWTKTDTSWQLSARQATNVLMQ
ncbi:MAG: nuclear transport factor 2 family protein [Bacteroidota bacterium]